MTYTYVNNGLIRI